MTDVALKEHLEALIEALRQELKAQRDGDLRALELAQSVLSERLESMNQFRAQVIEERLIYVRIDTFKWTVGFLVGLMALIVSIAKLWH